MKLNQEQTDTLIRGGWRREDGRWVHADVKDPTDGRRLFRCSNAVALVICRTMATTTRKIKQQRILKKDLNGTGRINHGIPVNL